MENNNSNYLKVSNDPNHHPELNNLMKSESALPLINVIFHNQLWGVIIFQALLGAATVFLAALSAAKLSGRRRGRWQRQIKDVLEMTRTINIIFNTSISLK